MDKIVTVRMPRALFDRLSILSKEQHYLDVSECLRSITRKRCLELATPYSLELSQIRSELSAALSQKEQDQKKDQLLKELKNILKELEGGTK
jgi:hypothetical protein